MLEGVVGRLHRRAGSASTGPTTIRQRAEGKDGRPLSLFVTEDGSTVSYPLLASGTVLIGRSDTCDLVLRNPLVSREHAILHLGDSLGIEDLGSANGTCVGGRPLQSGTRIPLDRGEAVFMGSAVLVAQDSDGNVARPPQMISFKQLEERVNALDRASSRSGVGLVHARPRGSLRTEYVTLLLAQSLAPGDQLAWTADGACRLLLLRDSQDEVATALGRMTKYLHAWNITIDFQHRFVPADGAPGLLSAASAALSPALETVVLARGSVIVGAPAMRRLFQLIDRVAPGDIGVLIGGETGAGKDVIASAIHDRSPRREKPFLRVNCAALSASLLETELFGHEAGAFTGAKGMKPGLLETAHGGTVFLDEVGELPLSVQAKLLHALESREVTRVGGLIARQIDVRFISATNKDLERAVSDGTFREDLYFRLNGMTLLVPPLRERRSEIEPLVRLFIRNVCRQLGRREASVSGDALAALREHAWPGNVRELRNVIDRALLLCSADEIALEDLSLTSLRAGASVTTTTSPAAVSIPDAPARPTADPSDQRARIMAALDACAGNQSRAAQMLKMPRRTLVKRLAALDIPRPRQSRATVGAQASSDHDKPPSNSGVNVERRPPE